MTSFLRIEHNKKEEKPQNLLDIVHPGLHNDPLGPHIRRPAIMHERTQPNLDTMRAAELVLSDEHVQPSIPIAHVGADHVRRQLVLFHPVDFEVAEGLAVEGADDGEGVRGLEVRGEEGLLVRGGTGLAPGVGDARVVHPFVQELGVAHGGCGDVGGVVGEGEVAQRGVVGEWFGVVVS